MKPVERVLVCYSGHSSSTLDLSHYVAAGFEKAGMVVKRYRYDHEVRLAMLTCNEWAKQHDRYNPTTSDAFYLASKGLLSDIVVFKPDVVIIVTGILLYGSVWDWLREMQEGMKEPFILGLILTESPYQKEQELHCARLANIVWTNERAFVPSLRQFNPRSYWLPHAYEETVHFPDDSSQQEFDVYFCGTGQNSRAKLWAETNWEGITFRLEGMFPDLLKEWPHMGKYYRDGLVPNSVVAQRCRSSAICLNRHRRESLKVLSRLDSNNVQATEVISYILQDGEAECLNDRAIQIAACGAFQLCDRGRDELEEVFGDSVPTYDSPEELRDRVLYYLRHEGERKQNADRAYQAIRHRTYANNARTMLRHIAEVF